MAREYGFDSWRSRHLDQLDLERLREAGDPASEVNWGVPYMPKRWDAFTGETSIPAHTHPGRRLRNFAPSPC